MRTTQLKIVLGFLLAFLIGVVCRLMGVPLPAPHAFIGALLVVAMSAGYVVTDRFVLARAAKDLAPTGEQAMRERRTP